MKFLKDLSRRKWFILALMGMLLAAWGLFTYFSMAHTPMDRIPLTPGDWTFALADGTPITPDEAGLFPLPDPEAEVYCTTHPEGLTHSAILGLNSRNCDLTVFADGQLIADPSGSGVFTIGAAKELTLAVRFLTPEASISMLPSATIYPESYAYNSVYLTEGAKAALPAGIYLTVAVALSLLFLFQLYHQKWNVDVLLLALVALSFSLLNTLPYGVYVVWFLQTPFVTYILRLLPTLMLLWILWYRWNGNAHRVGWLLPLLFTVAVAAGTVWRQLDPMTGNQFTNLLQGKLLPPAMLLALAVCVWQAFRGNDSCRRFCTMGGGLAGLIGLATLVSFLRDGSWAMTLRAAFQNTALLGWFEPLQLVNRFLLILLFLLAVYDFVMSIVRRNGELRTLTLQNRYAAEHAAQLRRSLDETRETRHEMRHHIHALQGLCADGDLERVRSYVDTIGSQFSSDPVRYSDHALINALVTSCARQARELGAEFDASVQVPETLDIRDTDLAVILSNMIDNALEALAAVPNEKDRSLQLKAAIFEDTGLFISCTNTFAGELKQDSSGNFLTTKGEEGHGLGIKAMHRVAEAYNSILIPEVYDNTFHVKTYLYFKKEGHST